MTDDEAKAVGLRAAACKGWRWMRGVALGPDGRQVVLCDHYEGEATTDGLWLFNSEPDAGPAWCMGPDQAAGVEYFADRGPVWPDFRDPATMGAGLAVWQARPGHVFECPCPVLTYAAVYGLTDMRTIVALVEAMEAAAARVAP
jgi:hypothetical protein